MTYRIRRNILSAAGQIVVQTLILLVLYRYLLVTIGVERLGIWAIVLATVSAARISELGLAGSVTKFVATYRAQNDELAVVELLQTAALTIAAALGLLLLVGYPFLSWVLPYILPQASLDDGRTLLPFALVSLWISSVASIWMGGLDGCLRSDLRATIMIIGSVTMLSVSVAAVDRYGLVGLATAQILQGVVLLVFGWIAIGKVLSSMPTFPTQWKINRLRDMFIYGINFQANTVMMMLFEPTAKILFGYVGDLAGAGYFEMAQRVVTRLRAIIVESNRVIVPVFAGISGSGGDVTNLYVRNVQLMFFTITPLFSILLALTPIISDLWIGSHQPQFIEMTVVLSIAWYVNSVTAPAYFAYLGQGTLRWVTVAHITMGVINVLCGLVFGGLFGWHGIIVAFSLALVVGSVIPALRYHREHGLRIGKILTMSDVVLSIVCAVATVLALIGYRIAVENHVDVSVRDTATVAWIIAAVIVGAWPHPLRRKIFVMLNSRFRIIRRNP